MTCIDELRIDYEKAIMRQKFLSEEQAAKIVYNLFPKLKSRAKKGYPNYIYSSNWLWGPSADTLKAMCVLLKKEGFNATFNSGYYSNTDHSIEVSGWAETEVKPIVIPEVYEELEKAAAKALAKTIKKKKKL